MSDFAERQIGFELHEVKHTIAVYSGASAYSEGAITLCARGWHIMPMRYSLALKALRKRAKLKQQELADMVGVEQPTIARWEAGKQKPNLEMLDQLAVALGVHPGEMFQDTEMSAQPDATASALQTLVSAAIRSAPGNVPASSVRPIVHGLTRGLELLIRNPAMRTNPDALAVAVHAIESPSLETSLPA